MIELKVICGIAFLGGLACLVVGILELQHDCRTDQTLRDKHRELKSRHIDRMNQDEP